ncbi:MAG: hypothetical protein ACI3V4_02540 [Faecousia sp.]
MFRYKRSIPVTYELQGYIYFTSQLYRELPKGKQAKIRKLCEEAAGEYADALFLFVTTDTSKAEVCAKYFISESTLERVVRRYYMAFQRSI